MTYEELEKEISSVPRFGSDPDLANLSEYLKMLNHPEASLRVIHVAGTNGKGSVCAYIESVLRQAGFRTALFTSPHLVRMNERFRINFKPVEDEDMIRAWLLVKRTLREGERRGLKPVTWFEIIFLMSLIIFKDSHVDYCIMETGLGGRLDATALLTPVISVITSVSLDHTDILGDTIEAIAKEKAGIIKEKVPAVAFDEGNGAFPVLYAEAQKKNTHIDKVSCEDVTILKKRKNKIDFSINTSYYRSKSLTISGYAEYQIYNAALAVTALKIILPELGERAIQKGLLFMCWEGRMEQIRPGVFLDGAHNPGAVSMAVRTVRMDEGSWSLLFGVCSDKDYTEMIRLLSGYPWKCIYITRITGSRGAGTAAVKECFGRFSDSPLICDEDVWSAFKRAVSEKKSNEKILCLGSLYLVGEIKSLNNKLEDDALRESEDIQ